MKILLIRYVIFNLVALKSLSMPDQPVENKTKSASIYYPSPYDLEDSCSDEKAEVYIDPWKGAILQLGYKMDNKGQPKSRSIHRCRVDIRTKEGFWLAAAIEHMKFRGSRDGSNKWKCSDYIKFTAPRRDFVGKFLSAFDLNIFSAKYSEELCGDKRLDGEHLPPIYELSTDANSFHTASNVLSLHFHQDDDDKHTANNSFRIVVTTFRHASEQVFAVECEEKLKCLGGDIYCIDKAFICDGHVNCAFPGSGTDERMCKDNLNSDAFNMTSIIIVTLMSIIAFGIVICILSTLFCRIKSRLDNDRSQTPTFSSVPLSQPTAPRIDQEETLPAYETVIMGDATTTDKCSSGVEAELPPQYDSLFPEGPPVTKEDLDKDPVR